MRRIEWEKSDAKPVDASDNHVDPPLYTDDSDEELEGEELKRVEEIEEPTARQRQEHEEENHAIFRKWCPDCVAGRGVGGQHRR